MRRCAAWTRCRVVVIAALVVALTAGCPGTGSREKEPNEVDEARAQALLDDPWLDASQVTMTAHQAGSNNLYSPTTAGHDRRLRGTPEQAMLAEVAAAGEVGWSPFYGQCPAATGEDVPRQAAGYLMVLLARALPDGAVMLASVLVNGSDVYVHASAPNHAAPAVELPPPVELTDLACLSADGRGSELVGEAVDITEAS